MEQIKTSSNIFVENFISQCAEYERLMTYKFIEMGSDSEGNTSIDRAFSYLNSSRAGYKLPPVSYEGLENASKAYTNGSQQLRDKILINFTPKSDPLCNITLQLGNPLLRVAKGMQDEHRAIPQMIQDLASIEKTSPEKFVKKIQAYPGNHLVIKAISYLNAKRAELGLPPIRNTDCQVNLLELYQIGYSEWERHEHKRSRLILCDELQIPVDSAAFPESVTQTLNQ